MEKIIVNKREFSKLINGELDKLHFPLIDEFVYKFLETEGNTYTGVKDIKEVLLVCNEKTQPIKVSGVFIDEFKYKIPKGYKKGDIVITLEFDN